MENLESIGLRLDESDNIKIIPSQVEGGSLDLATKATTIIAGK